MWKRDGGYEGVCIRVRGLSTGPGETTTRALARNDLDRSWIYIANSFPCPVRSAIPLDHPPSRETIRQQQIHKR